MFVILLPFSYSLPISYIYVSLLIHITDHVYVLLGHVIGHIRCLMRYGLGLFDGKSTVIGLMSVTERQCFDTDMVY
jgi:hypothetical protein